MTNQPRLVPTRLSGAARVPEPPKLSREQQHFLDAMSGKVSVLAIMEAENILKGGISGFHGATTDDQKRLCEEAKRRRVFRFNGQPL